MSRGEWNPDATGPGHLYMAMADHIAARIEAGELVPGARLSNERELAEEYSVALGTVRRAVQELRDRGLAETWRGKGTYVTSTRADESED